MKIRLAGAGVLGALGTIAVLAATGFGEGSSRGPDVTSMKVTAHGVSAPSAGAATSAAAKRARGTRVIYRETAPKTLTDGTHDVVVGTCPRRSGAIDGYYLPDDFGVNMQGTAVRPNLRKWELVLDNQATPPADRQVIFGIICLKP
jgi:hypothetical protein